jgi:alpha-L-fucosidase
MHINGNPENLENIRWWTEARFGMFVHFGLYAVLGRGEWVRFLDQIPRDEYMGLMPQFNPSRFDADEWVGIAQSAGARYITITAKHHDGFCLFDSALTDFKITNTPFGRDLIGELIAACHRHDMRIVLYYSQPDWHHPNFVNRPGAFKEWPEEPPDAEPDWPKYQEFLAGQVRELCTNYGRIDGIWWDGTHRSEADWQGQRLYEMIKAHQPHAVVNDRARYGDFFTPERQIPALPVGVPCECCDSTTVKAWGYQPGSPLRSVPRLLHDFLSVASLGANYLLNVGPLPDGTIATGQQDRLRALGKWLETNGEAVYGSEGCVFAEPIPDVKVTRRGNSLYLHLLRWPESDWLELPCLDSVPTSVRLLGQPGELHAHQGGGGPQHKVNGQGQPVTQPSDSGVLQVGPLPGIPPTSLAHTLVLEFASAPVLRLYQRPEQAVPTLELAPDEPTELGVEHARLDGHAVKAQELQVNSVTISPAQSLPMINSGQWALNQTVTWQVRCTHSGRYEIAMRTRIAKGSEGARLAVHAAGHSLAATTEPNRPEDQGLHTTILGSLDLPSGEHELILQPEELLQGHTLGGALRSLVLSPVEGRGGVLRG